MNKYGYMFALIALLATGCTQKTIDLSLSVPVGETFRQEVIIDQNIKQQIMGNEEVTEQLIGFTSDMEVLDVDDAGNRRIKLTYLRVRHEMKSRMGNIDTVFDTDTVDLASAHPLSRGYGAMKGATLEYIQSPKGEIRDMVGADELMDRVLAATIPDPAQREAARTALSNQFGDRATKELMQHLVVPFPERALAIGETWKGSGRLSTGLAMILDNTYTLVGLEGDRAEIEMASVVTADKSQPLEMGGGMQITGEMSGNQTGRLIVDRKTGLISESEIKQSFSGSMSMQGMDVPISIEGTVTTKTLDPRGNVIQESR